MSPKDSDHRPGLEPCKTLCSHLSSGGQSNDGPTARTRVCQSLEDTQKGSKLQVLRNNALRSTGNVGTLLTEFQFVFLKVFLSLCWALRPKACGAQGRTKRKWGNVGKAPPQ